ncbi:MAG: ABC transporter substrate-binding protein [Chloroflexota bacterium]|nr:ABC transporter substrate-binding protein [Chloroflexota bacterium]
MSNRSDRRPRSHEQQPALSDLNRRDLLKRAGVVGGATILAGGFGALGPASAAAQDGGRRVRQMSVLVEPQANVPEQFETIQLSAQRLRDIGFDIEVAVMPWEQQSDTVWFDRESWDMTAWQMVGRPERLDPDEFIYNLFHSSTIEDGYNFVGYSNPAYDELAEAQRVEVDHEARVELVYQLQEIIGADQPYMFAVYPHENYAFSTSVWDPATVVDAKGIGIKNYWTFVGAAPLSDQTDMILNTQSSVQAMNPLYISGGADSWITELIWDRLMRIDADGLPQPYAAESVEWTDDTTVLVTLRPDLMWHDGEPVTVKDVIFSFQAPAGEMSPMYKPFVAPIESVTAVGDNQVEFKLLEPFAAFLTSGLSKLNLIPKHVWEPVLADLAEQGINAEQYQEETPIGSGPFKYVNWARNQEIILEANADHFNAPKMTRWIMRDMPNVAAALGGLQSGELNFLSDYTGDPTLLQQAADSSGGALSLVSTIVVGFRFLAPNHRRAPFGDAAVRRAMATAIGRDQIRINIYKDIYATNADSHVSKALEAWHAPDLPEYAVSDVEAARAILAEAGYDWDDDGFLLYPEGQTETL